MSLSWYKKRGLLSLHRRNKKILSLHLSEKAHVEIAKQFGISKSRVDQIVLKHLRMDRKLLKVLKRYL